MAAGAILFSTFGDCEIGGSIKDSSPDYSSIPGKIKSGLATDFSLTELSGVLLFTILERFGGSGWPQVRR